jgi:hypothetical protein
MLGGYVGLVDSHLCVPQEMPLGAKLLATYHCLLLSSLSSLIPPHFLISSDRKEKKKKQKQKKLLCVAYGISSTPVARFY